MLRTRVVSFVTRVYDNLKAPRGARVSLNASTNSVHGRPGPPAFSRRESIGLNTLSCAQEVVGPTGTRMHALVGPEPEPEPAAAETTATPAAGHSESGDPCTTAANGSESAASAARWAKLWVRFLPPCALCVWYHGTASSYKS